MKVHVPAYYSAYYLSRVIDPQKAVKAVNKAVRYLKQFDFDAVAFTGMSGALVAPQIAAKLDKSLILVRKKEDVHHGRGIEGDFGIRSFVIVDDCIATGTTVKHILKQIGLQIPFARCIGAYLYHDDEFGYELISVEKYEGKRKRNAES